MLSVDSDHNTASDADAQLIEFMVGQQANFAHVVLLPEIVTIDEISLDPRQTNALK